MDPPHQALRGAQPGAPAQKLPLLPLLPLLPQGTRALSPRTLWLWAQQPGGLFAALEASPNTAVT